MFETVCRRLNPGVWAVSLETTETDRQTDRQLLRVRYCKAVLWQQAGQPLSSYSQLTERGSAPGVRKEGGWGGC